MKQFIDKLIERLEAIEEHCLDMHDWQGQSAIVEAKEIVNQLAEEYKNQNTDQDLMIVESLPSLYPMMQPFEEEAVYRVVERAKYNNGWTPCLEKLPVYLDNVLVCTKNGGRTIAHLKHAPIEWRDMHMNKIDDVIAWQPLPEPFKPIAE